MVSVYDLLFYTIIFFVSLVFMVLLGTYWNYGSEKYNLPPSPLSLPIIGHLHLLDTFPNRSFQKLSSRYGPIIYLRLGSHPCVVASSPELAKELLMNNEKKFLTHPASIAIHHVTYESSGFAFCSYGPYWKFMKKLVMSQFLGGSALVQLQPVRKDEIRRLVRYLVNKSKDGEIVNVTDELMKLSTNIVTRMMVTNRYSTDGKDAQDEELRNLIREVSGIFGLLNVHDFLDFIPRFFDFQGVLKTAKDVRRRYDVLLEEIILEREETRKMRKGDEERDVLDMLLDAVADKNSDVKITRDNVKAVVLDIVTAGTDTSAGAVEWGLAELINHPRIFKKAREEIDSVVGVKNRLVEESDLPDLPYLQAIFKEILRLHPPVPLLIRDSTQDCKVGGYDIPANTRLFVNVWSMNRNPKYWKDPLEFKPERFLANENTGENYDVKGQHFEFLPFGTGRRGCPGMWLSLVEVPTVLAAMIQCFDWKTVGNERMIDMSERFGLTLPKADPLTLIPVTRFDPSVAV
ncbi:hypothetical protein C5167_044892 [Papaver somniferum]|uniref:Cytochrome P450 n=1 Tax=Papaver somniferum TaxID=3469 RepID=A0A4Y7LC61_PAPSO|nr:3,9-dihydroxypterocarpan 6A-monooxygenase-like [Papaver somniferum]RZC82108.1 hypothetical protein C5167_044892 [Papaver somniferum]